MNKKCSSSYNKKVTAHAGNMERPYRPNPIKWGQAASVQIISQRPASAIEGLFFVVIIRDDERYQHPERDH